VEAQQAAYEKGREDALQEFTQKLEESEAANREQFLAREQTYREKLLGKEESYRDELTACENQYRCDKLSTEEEDRAERYLEADHEQVP